MKKKTIKKKINFLMKNTMRELNALTQEKKLQYNINDLKFKNQN